MDCILDQGELVVVLEGDLDLALILSSSLLQLINIDIVRGHTFQLFGFKPDSSVLVIQIGLSLDLEFAQTLLDLFEPLPLGALGKMETISHVLAVLLLEHMALLRAEVLSVLS